MHAQSLCHVSLSATLWTIVHQVPLPIRFFQQEYWSGVPYSSPEDLPDPGIEPASLVSPALAGGLYHRATWEAPPYNIII